MVGGGRWKLMKLVAAGLVVVVLAGCSHAQLGQAETAAAKLLVSDEQENQIGLQVKQQLEQQQHVKYLDDPAVVAFVKRITDKILPLAEKDRPGVKWQVHVIDDPKTVNAFAAPGGYLYVYSGLLLAADDASQVAGVLSHEAGARGGPPLGATDGGRDGARSRDRARARPGPRSHLPGRRGRRRQGVAARQLARRRDRGGRVRGALRERRRLRSARAHRLLPKLRKLEGQQPGFAKFLSDHPATTDRIAHLRQFIAEHHLTGSAGHDPGDLTAVKARIPKGAGAPGSS